MAEVDAKQGYAGVADQFGRTQHAAVAAEDHAEVDRVKACVFVEDFHLEELPLDGVADRLHFQSPHHRDQAS